jgi:hypothetical protein
VKPVLTSERDLERAIARHLDVLDPRDGQGAVELPRDAAAPMRIIPFAHDVN